MLPLIKPKLYAARNRWRKRGSRNRDAAVGTLSVLLMFLVFSTTANALYELEIHAGVSGVLLNAIVQLLLMALFGLLLLSAAVASLGSLYLASDLDLILASPISRTSFFTGRLIGVFGNASWMGLLFGVPIFVAFATILTVPLWHLAAVIAVLLLVFVLASALAMAAVAALATIWPAGRTREVILVSGGMAIVAAFYVFENSLGSERLDQQAVAHMVASISAQKNVLLPILWASHSITEILQGRLDRACAPAAQLLLFVIAALSLAYALVALFHYRGFSWAKSARPCLSRSGHYAHSRLRVLPLTPYVRAIWAKEYRVFTRDMVQAFQLLLLLGLCLFYLFNFRVLGSVNDLPDELTLWWQGVLVLANIGFGAFVTTAVGTRFVYPAVSFEGQSFWVIQSSPLSYMEFLRAKFHYWLMPVATISSVVLASGALAINSEPHIVAINAVSSWVISYGVVGMAVGLGAYFASFHWEHITQLTASIGSLAYMIACCVLIVFDLLPAGLLIALRVLKNSGTPFTTLQWYVCVTSASALLVYANYSAAQWAIRLGERGLRRKFS